MFTIGEFARLGSVSVRMLRHYDLIGLLPPAHVDPATGYRSYDRAQLGRLDRIVALRDLGFSLEQIGPIVECAIGVDEFRGMLRLREAQLDRTIADEQARLARVRARLRFIEEESVMSDLEIRVKSVPPVRAVVTSVRAERAEFGIENLGPVVRGPFRALGARLRELGVTVVAPPFLSYEGTPGEDDFVAHIAFPIGDGAVPDPSLEVAVVPGIERAATVVAATERTAECYRALGRWMDANGYRFAGHGRDVVLSYGQDGVEGMSEHQMPLGPRD